jgi:hypothetical protein
LVVLVGLISTLLVLNAVPAILVLTVGLLVLIRRRAALGRPATIAIAATAVLLAGALLDVLLGLYSYQAIEAVVYDMPWWLDVADVLLLPADLLGLPLLVWAVLAGRGRRPVKVTS